MSPLESFGSGLEVLEVIARSEEAGKPPTGGSHDVLRRDFLAEIERVGKILVGKKATLHDAGEVMERRARLYTQQRWKTFVVEVR
jgi:hypothetical protein